jgi:hypothetical protein
MSPQFTCKFSREAVERQLPYYLFRQDFFDCGTHGTIRYIHQLSKHVSRTDDECFTIYPAVINTLIKF